MLQIFEGGESDRNDAPGFVNSVPSWGASMCFCFVYLRVTIAADQFKVAPVERNVWIRDVLRGQMVDMVNDHARNISTRAQTAFA